MEDNPQNCTVRDFCLQNRRVLKPYPEQNIKQEGRLPPAYFFYEYKLFDQHLPTVENETTVQNIVYEEFLQTSIPPLISIFYAKDVVQIFLSQYQKISVGNTSVFQKNSGIEKFYA